LSIQVYEDNWLLSSFPTKIASPRDGSTDDLRVSKLINPVTWWWDNQKIDRMFLLFEAQKIKEVPL